MNRYSTKAEILIIICWILIFASAAHRAWFA